MNYYKTTSELKKGIILARVSTPKQEQEGLSLQELQVPTLVTYCLEQGITIDSSFRSLLIKANISHIEGISNFLEKVENL